jgi:hypothetical protein
MQRVAAACSTQHTSSCITQHTARSTQELVAASARRDYAPRTILLSPTSTVILGIVCGVQFSSWLAGWWWDCWLSCI